MKSDKEMKETYESYYSSGYSFRDQWFGKIAQSYIIPKYFFFLDEFIKDSGSLSFLEVGAGNGEITDFVRGQRPNWHITPTEMTSSGVDALKTKGYQDAKVVEAIHLTYPDAAFDYVVCFDVMHHVSDPAKMAAEMLRVARKGVFLIEANRKSVIRRLLEKTATYRKAGEYSYYPNEYEAFFQSNQTEAVAITPFQFIPPKLSNYSLRLTIGVSEWVGRLPVLKWQCSGLAIRVTKKNKIIN